MKRSEMPRRSGYMPRGSGLQRRTQPKTDPQALVPQQRGAGLQRSGRLNPVSATRAAESAVRRAVIRKLFAEPALCRVYALSPEYRQVIPVGVLRDCARWADDPHEPHTRGRGGSITDPGNIVPLCRSCHRHVTDDPTSQLGWAYEMGLLVHSWDAASRAVAR